MVKNALHNCSTMPAHDANLWANAEQKWLHFLVAFFRSCCRDGFPGVRKYFLIVECSTALWQYLAGSTVWLWRRFGKSMLRGLRLFPVCGQLAEVGCRSRDFSKRTCASKAPINPFSMCVGSALLFLSLSWVGWTVWRRLFVVGNGKWVERSLRS